MGMIDSLLTKLYVKAYCELENFKDSERGDTNFVSMLLIIGIVVVLAGLFLTLGKSVMETITTNINNFLDSLQG